MNSFATKPESHANVLTAAKFTRNLIWDFFTRGFRKDTSDFWAQTVGRISMCIAVTLVQIDVQRIQTRYQ